MSKSTEDTLKAVGGWLNSLAVGSLLIHKGPRQDVVILAEETIKMANLDDKDRNAVTCLLAAHDAFKVDVITGKDGPDRIKVTRQL